MDCCGPATGPCEACYYKALAMNVDDRLKAAELEIARLKREGSPGVLHEVDRAFYNVTVKERDHANHLVTSLTGVAAQYQTEAKGLRRLLFLRHGCPITTLYGDDGEMHCSACSIDFKRMSADEIEERFVKNGLRELIKAAEPQHLGKCRKVYRDLLMGDPPELVEVKCAAGCPVAAQGGAHVRNR